MCSSFTCVNLLHKISKAEDPPGPAYSYRSAIIGSTRVAFLAGM